VFGSGIVSRTVEKVAFVFKFV